MINYQLYRTNVLLGGQMKWDIIVDSTGGDLYVDDFHITPISDTIPYNKYAQNELLNYSHHENIKTFYKNIEGSFYENYIDTQLNHDWPIISNHPIKSYNDTFDMGCKRIENFSIYKKQFEFLCPVWLEQLTDDLAFTINLKIKSSKQSNEQIIASKSLILHNIGKTYHDRFVKYFKDYLSYTGIDKGTEEVLNVDLKHKTAQLSGLDVSSGNVVQRDVKSIVNNLLSRERPLMESDNFLISSFKNTHTIAKQLFNFNICFNLEDIIGQELANMLYGHNVTFEIFAGSINNETNKIKNFELVDFYSNYEYIPKVENNFSNIIDEYDKDNPNVLDYLKDNLYIDFINKNKFAQNIIHWSLTENNDYIFNVYEGFSGFSKIKKEDGTLDIVKHSHQYANSPDLTQSVYSSALNNMNWANNTTVEGKSELNKLISSYLDIDTKLASNFNNKWVNNIKYNKQENIKIYLIYVKDPNALYEGHPCFDIIAGTDLFYYKPKVNDQYLNLLMFASSNKNDLTFAYIKNIMNTNNIDDKHFNLLKDIMNSAISPYVVDFNKSLNLLNVDGPTLSVKEIYYYKDNNFSNYITRYDGKIKPAFISKNINLLYYKDYVNDDRKNGSSILLNSDYNKYTISGYTPLYPSINYCAIKSTPYKYNMLPEVKVTGLQKLNESYSLNPDIEYKWYNDGTCLALDDQLEFKVEFEQQDNNLSTEEIVKKYLKDHYHLDNEIVIDYIYTKYIIENDYDCFYNESNKLYYIYKLKLKLK